MKHLHLRSPVLLSFILLMDLCIPLPALDTIEDLVGPLTAEQLVWLEGQPVTKKALAEIAGKHHWPDRQQADAIFDHFTAEVGPILSASQIAQEVAILKVLHPEWNVARVVFTAAWNVTKGRAHNILDLAGLLPGLGEGADLVNGVFYLLEGDKANAAFSFAAMAPFLGWASTRAKIE